MTVSSRTTPASAEMHNMTLFESLVVKEPHHLEICAIWFAFGTERQRLIKHILVRNPLLSHIHEAFKIPNHAFGFNNLKDWIRAKACAQILIDSSLDKGVRTGDLNGFLTNRVKKADNVLGHFVHELQFIETQYQHQHTTLPLSEVLTHALSNNKRIIAFLLSLGASCEIGRRGNIEQLELSHQKDIYLSVGDFVRKVSS